MQKYKSTIQMFVSELFDSCKYGVDLMTVEDAKGDLENFKNDGYNLPDGITAEEYMKAWNNLVKEHKGVEA